MRKVSTLVGLSLLALAGSAGAQEATAPADTAAPAADATAAPGAEVAPAPEAMTAAPAATGYPVEYALRPLTLAAGTFQVTVPIVLNLSKDAVLKPVWVPLDLRFGINDQLEVFVNHSHTPVASPAALGGGVCLGGKERGCTKASGDATFYDNANIGAQFSFLKDAGLELSAIVAAEIRSIDPMHAAANVGLGFKYIAGQLGIKAAPTIGIGINKRSEGNKEFLAVPVQAAFQATPELALFLDTGLFSPTEKMGDSYMVPVGIGASFAALPNLDVGGELMLPALLAGYPIDDAKGVNIRTLMVFASYRTK